MILDSSALRSYHSETKTKNTSCGGNFAASCQNVFRIITHPRVLCFPLTLSLAFPHTNCDPEGMEPEDKTMDYPDYSDSPADSENLAGSQSETPDAFESDSDNAVVGSSFVLPDPGKALSFARRTPAPLDCLGVSQRVSCPCVMHGVDLMSLCSLLDVNAYLVADVLCRNPALKAHHCKTRTQVHACRHTHTHTHTRNTHTYTHIQFHKFERKLGEESSV